MTLPPIRGRYGQPQGQHSDRSHLPEQTEQYSIVVGHPVLLSDEIVTKKEQLQ